jgi:HEAT repeat protein
VSQWIDDLGAKDLGVRWYATYALGRIGPDAAPAIASLQAILANLEEHEYVRGGAAWALGRMGEKAAPAVPLLVRTLSSKHVSVRRNAAAALGNVAAARQSFSSPVAREKLGVHESSPGGPLGSQTAPAVSALLRLLDDEDPAVRVAAAAALWRIERHPRATAVLEAMLRAADVTGACQAAVALGELGSDARQAVPALVAALGRDDADTRRAAAAALGRIGPGAIPALLEVLTSGNKSFSPEPTATASSGPEPTTTRTRREAAEALGAIGIPAIPALIEALGDPGPPVRRAAARALGRLGPAAKKAVPALLRTASDPQPEVRDTAAQALRQIRGS